MRRFARALVRWTGALAGSGEGALYPSPGAVGAAPGLGRTYVSIITGLICPYGPSGCGKMARARAKMTHPNPSEPTAPLR